MKYLSTAILAAAAIVVAKDPYEACPHSGRLVCCRSNVLKLAYLSCFKPDSTPDSAEDLDVICSEEKSDPTCCSAIVASLGLLCQDAEGFRHGHLHLRSSDRRVRRDDEDTPPNGAVSTASDEPDPDDVLESLSSLIDESSKPEEVDDILPDISSLFDENKKPEEIEGVLPDNNSQPEKPEDIDDILPDVASLFDETETVSPTGVDNILPKPSDEAEDIDDILPDLEALFEENEIPSSTSLSPGAPSSVPNTLDGDEIIADIWSLFEEHKIPEEDIDEILPDIALLFSVTSDLDDILVDITDMAQNSNNPDIEDILPDIASLFEERRTKSS